MARGWWHGTTSSQAPWRSRSLGRRWMMVRRRPSMCVNIWSCNTRKLVWMLMLVGGWRCRHGGRRGGDTVMGWRRFTWRWCFFLRDVCVKYCWKLKIILKVGFFFPELNSCLEDLESVCQRRWFSSGQDLVVSEGAPVQDSQEWQLHQPSFS